MCREGTEPNAALVDAWLARVGVRIHGFIPRLTDPASFGGDPSDAFTVVAPSLPGYGLSSGRAEAVRRRGDGGLFRRANDRDARLQALRRPGRRLGRHHRRAHGLRACRQADRHPCQFSAVRREPDRIKNPNPEQRVFLDQLNHWLKEDAA